MTVRVSGSEPPSLRAIGRTTNLPEEFGADVAWPCPLGLMGGQRKIFPADFMSSVSDGRLGEQVQKMRRLSVRFLVLEGRGTWSTEGELVVGFGQPWTLAQHWRFLASIQLHGVWVFQVASLDETIALVKELHDWSMKREHRSLDTRPKPKGAWGKPTDKEWGRHLLQSFDGVGPEMAGRIVEEFGRVPLAWTVTPEEMGQVHGVGAVRVKKMFDCLAEP